MQFRIFRYRSSRESSCAEDLYESEFEFEEDPRLSVYDIGEKDTCRIQLEHKAGAGIDPPRGGYGVDLSPLRRSATLDDPGGIFEFRRRTHHILDLASSGDVRQLAEELFEKMQSEAVCFEDKKVQLRAYLQARVQERDSEWSDFLADASNKWRQLAGLPKK